MTEAFYVPDGDRFVPQVWTKGPWDERAQHAGPPAALAARAIEMLEPDWRVARFTFEILRPIPVTPLRVSARVTRPGKRVQWCEAALLDEDGTEVAHASSWRIRSGEAPETALDPTPYPAPESCEESSFLERGDWYFSAMEWRFAAGSFFERGPAVCWMRMRYPLIAGEEPSPLARVLTVADSGNGISRATPMREYMFINTELSVHLVREPAGEWVCLDATTRIGAEGIGLAQSVLWDERSRIGAGAQSLLIARR